LAGCGTVSALRPTLQNAVVLADRGTPGHAAIGGRTEFANLLPCTCNCSRRIRAALAAGSFLGKDNPVVSVPRENSQP